MGIKLLLRCRVLRSCQMPHPHTSTHCRIHTPHPPASTNSTGCPPSGLVGISGFSMTPAPCSTCSASFRMFGRDLAYAGRGCQESMRSLAAYVMHSCFPSAEGPSPLPARPHL